MSTEDHDTGALHDLLEGEGSPVPAGHLSWLALTWDLVSTRGTTGVYHRFFLTADSYVATRGPRNPCSFQRTSPSLGDVAASSDRHPWALRDAMALTESLLETGHALVCHPLAVDLSTFQYDVAADGTTFDNAGDLIRLMRRSGFDGQAVLAEINTVRGRARDTHLDPDWRSTGHTDPDALWEGR